MQDKRFPNWRSWAAVIILVIVGVVIVIAWPRAQVDTAVPVEHTPELKPQATPQPLTILDRLALLEATARAASAHAAGKALDADSKDLAGRRFELVLPLGCNGPLPEGGPVENGWRYDLANGVLHVAFPSNVMGVSENLIESGRIGGATGELGRSFWIKREWLREAVCPLDGTQETADLIGDEPSVAIAEIVEAEAPRSNDGEGRDYRVSKRVDVDQAPDTQGLRIIVSGRLTAEDNGPIQCLSTHKDRRPSCVILARFDRVALTNASMTQIYGEWRN
jgi:hypothetical protein